MNQMQHHPTPTEKSILPLSVSAKSNCPSSITRALLLWSGHILLGIGFVGILLPVLPTTVFWIGAALCYARSSEAFYQKIISHKRFGQAIQCYLEHGVISTPGKVAAIMGMGFSAVIIGLAPLNPMVTILALLSLAAAATYVGTRPSTRTAH